MPIKKHGYAGTPIYKVWHGIKRRCYSPTDKNYSNYGGRGIKLCDEWLNDPKSFCEWAIANGYEKGLTIDRIDPNGDYEPSNCQCITKSENTKKMWKDNKKRETKQRKLIEITYKGETKTIPEWAEKTGISKANINSRYHNGWDIEKIFETPVREVYRCKRKYKKKY